jgi:hypothetical protein
LYSLRKKQKRSKILSSVSSCVSFVPVIICIIYPELSSKSVNIPVLIFVFVFFSFLFYLQCIMNVLLPAYISFFCHQKRTRKNEFKNIFVVKTWIVLYYLLMKTKQFCK